MKYVLINRSNVVVDILDGYIRYIKLQPENGITVACAEAEGTGVIGSDCNTHYVLIKADTQSNPDAVSVVAFDDIADDIRPNVAYLDQETGQLISNLNKAKSIAQNKNKELFSEYLSTHPLTWVNGKKYGITQEDQAEISLNINQYQMAAQAGVREPVLEWHAKGEENKPWDLETLLELNVAIAKAVYPKYHKMQQFKTQIARATSIEELEAIEISYK